MFLNYSGPPTQRPDLRRQINLHLSRIAKAKRPSKYDTEKLDRRKAQQRRRRREAEAKALQEQDAACLALNIALRRQTLGDAHVLWFDLLMPIPASAGEARRIHAWRDFFTIYIPYEGRALGLTPAAREDYAKSLMNWSLSHESVVYGLAIYPLCCLPESQDLYSVVRKTIEYLRAKALASINSQLTARIVDDTLIQAIVLAIATDDYLGYVDFGEAHLQGLESLIPLRGGFDTIGTSEPSMKNLQQALLTSVSALKLNISTSLRAHASTPLYRPSYPLSRETIDLVRPLRVGFRNLVRLGFLSTETIHLLTSFSAWLGALPADAAYSAQGWRRPIPAGLNNFEKCIVIALICLGDDLTGLGGHIGALMWRKPAQRAEILLWERSLWREPHFADVTLWMATVICCPQRQDIVPHSQWTILQDRIMGVRGDLHTLLDVERTMRCFFFPSFRMIALVSAWLSRLAP